MIVKNPNQIKTTATASFGEELLGMHEYELIPAIDLKENVIAGGGMKILCKVPPQKLLAYVEDDEWTYYKGSNIIADEGILGSTSTLGGIKLPKAGNSSEEPAVFCRHNIATLYPVSGSIDFTSSIYRRQTSPMQQHSLVYNGRDGQVLYFTFTHRNQFGELVKSTVKHDLSTSTEISVGDAKIEIENITGATIRYKVLKHFF
jgi:hypothetical protein